VRNSLIGDFIYQHHQRYSNHLFGPPPPNATILPG
jgi:hypothetical protein